MCHCDQSLGNDERDTPFKKHKPQTVKLPKVTIKEVLDEQPLPIINPDAELIRPQDYPLPTEPTTNKLPDKPKPSNKLELVPETELKSVHLEALPELEEGQLLVAYLKGESVISIHNPGQSPFTKEFEEPTFSYSQHIKKISKLVKFPTT